MIGLRDDGVTDVGECKWGAYGGVPRLRGELEGKLRAYPNSRGATLVGRIFVQKRPASSKTSDGVARWYELRDLYAE